MGVSPTEEILIGNKGQEAKTMLSFPKVTVPMGWPRCECNTADDRGVSQPWVLGCACVCICGMLYLSASACFIHPEACILHAVAM